MPLKNITFTLTTHQIAWLKSQSRTTGLTQVELVRRALDTYVELEDLKAQRSFFSPAQRQQLRAIAESEGVDELEVIRAVIERGMQTVLQ